MWAYSRRHRDDPAYRPRWVGGIALNDGSIAPKTAALQGTAIGTPPVAPAVLSGKQSSRQAIALRKPYRLRNISTSNDRVVNLAKAKEIIMRDGSSGSMISIAVAATAVSAIVLPSTLTSA